MSDDRKGQIYPPQYLVRPQSSETDFLEDDHDHDHNHNHIPCWMIRSTGHCEHDTSTLAELNKILDKSSSVLYESNDYIILDKPPDLRMDGTYRCTVHKLTTLWYPSNLLLQQPDLFKAVERLHRHNYLIDNELRPIHQLDYPTSGVLLIGRNKRAAAVASNSFRKRQTKKTYLAIVHGHWSILDHEWPVLKSDRLQAMTEAERSYKKARDPKYHDDSKKGKTLTFPGFLPPHTAFVKWQNSMRKKLESKTLSADHHHHHRSEQTLPQRPEKKNGNPNKKGHVLVLEPQELDQVISRSVTVPLSTREMDELLNCTWKDIQSKQWIEMFEGLANEYNATLKAKQDNSTWNNTLLEPLPRIFRIQGEEKESNMNTGAFYIHAACAQIKGRYKMVLHPDAMPLDNDNTLLPTDVEQLEQLDFKPALTRCQIIKCGYLNGSPVTKVRLEPHTGRRHQLRLHMTLCGHPIVGDIAYERHCDPKRISPRMCLHAYQLELKLKGGHQTIVAPDPFMERGPDDDGYDENNEENSFRVKIPMVGGRTV